ncbi:MAG TPA: aminoacyl-tRNA hydrolase [Anaerolineae bacterium]|nr:aminoacyl-tRNA hydrolase [Anaerolineae bacterium]
MATSDKFLLVGLGNPGREYRLNRHNIGFIFIDRLAEQSGIRVSRVQQQAIIGQGKWKGAGVILAKPQTFMNRSGDSVAALARFFKIPNENVLVAYDDMDIGAGAIRLREKGGTGGHNGMKSIVSHLGQNFPRLRLGVGRPPGRVPPRAYVLQDFQESDQPWVVEQLDRAIAATATYVQDGIQLAMTRHNGQGGEKG